MDDAEAKNRILSKLESLKQELNKPNNLVAKGRYGNLLENLSALSLEELRLLAGSQEIHAAFLATGSPETVNIIYSEFRALGVGVSSTPATPGSAGGLPPASGRSAQEILAEMAAVGSTDPARTQRLSLELLAISKTPDGNFNLGVILPLVFGGSKLLGANIPESAKYSALAGLAAVGWNYFNSSDGQAMMAHL
jgi:hypothetical protein